MSIIFVIVKRYLTILHSIFIFFCVNKCSAQFINRHYVNFTQADGLPSNETYYIFRDSKNYMWMATDQGVIRYSGTSIDKYSLSDNIVFKIKEDKFGKIWFFTQTGRLSYFYKEKIFNYEYNDSIAKYIKTILITDAFIGDNNEIQINSIGGFNYNITDKGIITKKSYQPLHRFEALKFQITNSDNNYFSRSISHDSRIKDSLLLYFKGAHNDSVYRFFFGQTSYVQYGVEKNFSGDLFFYNSKYLIKIGPSGNYKIKQFDADILCVKPDSYGDIWVGLIKGGAHLLDNDLVENSKPLFLNKSITSIEFDYEKGVWLSTLESGVFYLKNLYAKPINGNQILDQPIFRLYNLNDSLLYFANSDGIYKRQNNKIAIVLKTKMITVNDLFVDNGNLFFTGIGPSLLVAKKETFYPENDLKNIFSFYSSHEISRYGESEFLINNHVQLRIFNYKFYLHNKKIDKSLTTINFPYISNIENLFIDNKKNIWVTSRRGLYKLNSINDTPKLFEPHKELFAKGVTYMQQLPNGLYILGLRFGGLIIMKDSSVVANISETSGLINNSVKYVLIDKDRLWIATANGISVVNFLSYSPLKYEVINIGKSKGLFNVVIYQLIKFKNNILAATSNGIYEIDDPGVYDNKKALPIPLYISNINYYKGDTVGVENLSVPYNKSRILIKYNCLCFNSPEEIKYYYRIAGSDSGWKNINSNELLLENLIPGMYKVEIKAALEKQQRYSEIKSLTLFIEKPWWQYNLIRIAGIFFIAVLLFLFYRVRIKKIRLEDKYQADIKLKLSELEQKALRSQINPHFIFNCLTSIQQLIVSGKNTEANLYLVKFSRLIRSTLEISLSPFISIEDEKKYLADYISLEQLRLPGKFDYYFTNENIDPELYEIPSMILQPIIENCIRHGLKNMENKGEIKLSFTLKENYLECKISDNGSGYDLSKKSQTHTSYALKNIIQRLAVINHLENNNETFFDIQNTESSQDKVWGTIVTIKLPFKIKTN